MAHIFLTIFILIFGSCFAQDDSLLFQNNSRKSYGIYLQYNGITKPYIELGFGKSTDAKAGHHPFTTGSYISSELKIDFNRTVLAPKLGVWASGGVAPVSMGISLIYYSDVTDFKNGSFRLRPEIGIGLFNFRSYAGINLPIVNYKLSKDYVNLFTAGLMLYLPIIEKK